MLRLTNKIHLLSLDEVELKVAKEEGFHLQEAQEGRMNSWSHSIHSSRLCRIPFLALGFCLIFLLLPDSSNYTTLSTWICGRTNKEPGWTTLFHPRHGRLELVDYL